MSIFIQRDLEASKMTEQDIKQYTEQDIKQYVEQYIVHASPTPLTFLMPKKQALIHRNEIIKTSRSQTIGEAINAIHQNATKKMQNAVASFSSADGSKDVIKFAELSSSGIVRKTIHANNYTAFHQSDKGIWSAIVGAAQGLHQEWNSEKSKFKEKKEPLAEYKTEALYQIAQAIVAQQFVHELNKKTLTVPPVIMVGNYMSRSTSMLKFGTNNRAVDIRSAVINDISNKGLALDEFDQLNSFIEQLKGNKLASSVSIGGKNQSAIPVYFTQQGVNTARHYSKSADASPLLEIAQKIGKTDNDQNTDMDTINKLIVSIKASEQTSREKSFFSQARSVISGMRGRVQSNEELYREALKILLVQEMGGAVVGGCQSAKDRYGVLRLTALTIQEYMEKKKVVPPAFGSKAYKEMSSEDRILLDQIFAKHYLAGHAQFVSNANTPGAAGLKNNNQILAISQRAAVMTAINNERKAEPSPSKERVLQLKALEPDESDKLSTLNKIKEAVIKNLGLEPKVITESAFTNSSSTESPELLKTDKSNLDSRLPVKTDSPQSMTIGSLSHLECKDPVNNQVLQVRKLD